MSKIKKSRNSMLRRNTGCPVPGGPFPCKRNSYSVDGGSLGRVQFGGKKWGKALLFLVTRLMIPRELPNSPANMKLHKEFLLLPPPCLTRHLLPFKNNHLDFVFLVHS